MTEGWRERLRGRFRGAATERIGRATAAVSRLSEGDFGARRDALRELHTLKGEANMLGFPGLRGACDAAESLLEALDGADAATLLDGRTRLELALGVLAAVCRGALADDGSELAEVCAALQREVTRPAAPAPLPDVAPASAAVHARRWVRVEESLVEELGAALEDGGAALDRLAALLGPALASFPAAAAANVREALERAAAAHRASSTIGWELRLVPVEPALDALAHHARELAAAQGKRLAVMLRGGGVAADRGVLDALADPLLHLVRNAVDHGIEAPDQRGDKPSEARLRIEARQDGGDLVIRVADDGRGVDVDAVRQAAVRRGLVQEHEAASLTDDAATELLFRHGFSTRATPGPLSGRGVGLDVVRAIAESLGGGVKLESAPGAGTAIELHVRARLGAERALVLSAGGTWCALPARDVLDVLRPADASFASAEGGLAGSLAWRGGAVEVRALADLLALEVAREGEPRLVVVAGHDRRAALLVHGAIAHEDLVRRPADALLGAGGVVAASAARGEQGVVFFLSVDALLRRIDRVRPPELTRVHRTPQAAPGVIRPRAPRPAVLLVDDSPLVCDMVGGILARAGFDVTTAPDASAALAALARAAPRVVITDLEMPGADGFELLARVRAAHPALPVVVLTSRGDDASRVRARGLGAAAYLEKSERTDPGLIETLERLVQEPP